MQVENKWRHGFSKNDLKLQLYMAHNLLEQASSPSL